MYAGPERRLRAGRRDEVRRHGQRLARRREHHHPRGERRAPSRCTPPGSRPATWPGAATTSWPSSGRSAPARSSAFTIALDGPEHRAGRLGRRQLRSGRSEDPNARGRVVVRVERRLDDDAGRPVCVTSSFGDVYAAIAAGTATSAASAASPTETVQIRPFISPPLRRETCGESVTGHASRSSPRLEDPARLHPLLVVVAVEVHLLQRAVVRSRRSGAGCRGA